MAEAIVVLEKEKTVLFGRLSVEISNLNEIVKITMMESSKELFSKLYDTV